MKNPSLKDAEVFSFFEKFILYIGGSLAMIFLVITGMSDGYPAVQPSIPETIISARDYCKIVSIFLSVFYLYFAIRE